jgi:hypothetical protein
VLPSFEQPAISSLRPAAIVEAGAAEALPLDDRATPAGVGQSPGEQRTRLTVPTMIASNGVAKARPPTRQAHLPADQSQRWMWASRMRLRDGFKRR